MTSLRLFATGIALGGLVMVTHAQRGAEGQEAARNAFPVPAAVRIVRNIPYARYGERQLRLDLYLPPTAARPVPGVIVIRGGGWLSGDKEAFGFIAGFLANRGFAAASIEYRASGEAKFPAAVYDTKAAVRWMRANANQYGIDPNRIAAMGGSAGAHLAALLGTSGDQTDLEGSGGNQSSVSRVQAVVAMACVSDLERFQTNESVRAFIGSSFAERPEFYKAASPITYASHTSAPLLLQHSETDPAVPFEQSVLLEARYRAVGAPVTLIRVDAPRTHAFWNDTKHFPTAMEQAATFLHRTLKPGS